MASGLFFYSLKRIALSYQVELREKNLIPKCFYRFFL